MQAYNFKLVNCDTDSITICKEDGSVFSEEENIKLLKELNSLYPSNIHWEPDGIFEKVIVVKAKNYVLFDGKKIKYKGSALKATMKEPALKQFIKDIIDAILQNTNNLSEIYLKYIKEIYDIKDMRRWASKKTITDKVLNPKRLNEQKVYDAIQGKEYSEGDKIYLYFKEDDSLCLIEDFDGNYNRVRLLEKLFKTSQVFDTIIEKGTFINYKLKKNQEKLKEIIDI